MSEPKLPPEWAEWSTARQTQFVVQTQTRRQLYESIGDLAGYHPRETGCDPPLTKIELGRIAVRLAECDSRTASKVILDL